MTQGPTNLSGKSAGMGHATEGHDTARSSTSPASVHGAIKYIVTVPPHDTANVTIEMILWWWPAPLNRSALVWVWPILFIALAISL
jgi:hypothetical protein